MIVPLPAVALEVSNAFPPLQNEAVPVMLADGIALTASARAVDVKEQPLLLVIVIVKEPAAVAV